MTEVFSAVLYKSLVFDDTSLTGGVVSSDTISLLSPPEIFGVPTATNLESGLIQYRKVFIKSVNPAHTAVTSIVGGPSVFILNPSTGEDYIDISVGTPTDILPVDPTTLTWASTGSISLVDDTTITYISDGSTVSNNISSSVGGSGSYVVITNNSSLGSVSGNEDFLEISSYAGSTTGESIIVLSATPLVTYDTSYKVCSISTFPTPVNLYADGIPVWIRRTILPGTVRSTDNAFAFSLIWSV
jgi:hypothetical protein